MTRLENKLIDQARLLIPFCSGGRCKHAAMLVRRNTIKSIGLNSFRTDPMSAKLNYNRGNKHAEFSCVKNFNHKRNPTPINHCSMYIIRIRPSGNVAFSHPCEYCVDLLDIFNIKRVFYTGDDGNFHSWNEPIQESWYSVMKAGKEKAGKPLILPNHRPNLYDQLDGEN